jgi:hypothetical protein
MSIELKPGMIVQYAKPINESESQFRFVLLHAEQGKVDIQLVCDDAIKPVETVAVSEITPAE